MPGAVGLALDWQFLLVRRIGFWWGWGLSLSRKLSLRRGYRRTQDRGHLAELVIACRLLLELAFARRRHRSQLRRVDAGAELHSFRHARGFRAVFLRRGLAAFLLL